MTILAKSHTTNNKSAAYPKVKFTAFRAATEAIGTLRRYQDVPLRFRRQWITAFLAGIILLSIVAGLFLSVASRTAITGREIQALQSEIIDNQRANADLEIKIATLLSSESLKTRAEAAGYTTMEGDQLNYMMVPGYYQPAGITLVTPAPPSEDISLSPEFNESLFTWLDRQLESASLPLAQGN